MALAGLFPLSTGVRGSAARFKIRPKQAACWLPSSLRKASSPLRAGRNRRSRQENHRTSGSRRAAVFCLLGARTCSLHRAGFALALAAGVVRGSSFTRLCQTKDALATAVPALCRSARPSSRLHHRSQERNTSRRRFWSAGGSISRCTSRNSPRTASRRGCARNAPRGMSSDA
jgi:hypothetical protein